MNMTIEKGTTHAQFLERMQQNPKFRKQQRLIKPFYLVAIEIIRLRNQLGITQKELAKRAGTHQTRISKIESSELDFRISTLEEIAEALECQLVISLVPISQEVYSKADEPYLLFETGAKIHADAPSSSYFIVGPQYQDGPVTEGTYGQCA
jgi:transcriptional regulator with XRE-family HTH domain